MNDEERRFAWLTYRVKFSEQFRTSPDWPDSLPISYVALLHDPEQGGSSSAMLAYLEAEIAEGRLAADERTEKHIVKRTRRRFIGRSSYLERHGSGASTSNGCIPLASEAQDESRLVRYLKCEDVARVIGSIQLGQGLLAWLAPYRDACNSSPSTTQQEGECDQAPVRPMKAAEIIRRLSARFPGIERALMKESPKRQWVVDARISHGIYDFEKIKAGCENEWPHLAERQAQPMSQSAQLARMNNR